MSLVSEALRKARARAAEGAPGTPTVPATLVLPPRRYRSGIGLVPLVLVAVAAALGGAAGVWWAVGRQRAEPRTAAAPADPAPGATAAPTASGPAPGRRSPAGAPSGTLAAPAGKDGTPGGAAPGTAAPTGDTGGTEVAAGPDADPAAPRATVRPPEPGVAETGGEGTARGDRRTREALIDADLGYAKLHLDYLVYRPGSPFGRVNGQDVIVGSTVAGFRVDEITADHIKLSDRRNVVILRVR